MAENSPFPSGQDHGQFSEAGKRYTKEGEDRFFYGVSYDNAHEKGNHHRNYFGNTSNIKINEIRNSLTQLSKTDPKNIQLIVARQLEILSLYYQDALEQSHKSFVLACAGSCIGLIFFMFSTSFALVQGLNLNSIIPLICGAIIQILSGIVFYLYIKTSNQLNLFRSSLEQTQAYLLANSLCEALAGEEKNKARLALVREICHLNSAP